jgi:hypothetical protein
MAGRRVSRTGPHPGVGALRQAHQSTGGRAPLCGLYNGLPDLVSSQVLSPVVLPDQKQRERYDAMAKPVLSISGPKDGDPTGLLSIDLRGTAVEQARPDLSVAWPMGHQNSE